ncbi:MAG: glycosyltransferase, partial [Deltaproteobacteria bacterium]|nr:glycosyltransferase [Deltaproteobacteria bacterium]
MSSGPRVAVCIATFKRPKGLDRLLEGISRLRYRGPEPKVRVVVVDNAPGSDSQAGQVCERWRSEIPDLVFEEEPEQGISFARNKGLDAAGEVDFIAFIDDDEAPAPEWLDELLGVQRHYDADVVRGPVLPRFENDPEEWVVKGRFFERPRYPTGTVLDRAFTHNVLFRYDPFGRDYRLSPKYARSGGSDTHLFHRMYLDGATIIWADDAVVYEWNPASRQTREWLLRRQYRFGLVRAAIDAELELHPSPRFNTANQALQRIVAGASGVVATAIGPKHLRIKSMALFASGLG